MVCDPRGYYDPFVDQFFNETDRMQPASEDMGGATSTETATVMSSPEPEKEKKSANAVLLSLFIAIPSVITLVGIIAVFACVRKREAEIEHEVINSEIIDVTTLQGLHFHRFEK